MVDDIGKELFEKIQKVFETKCRNHVHIQNLLKKFERGKADLIDVESYSRSIGAQLAESIIEIITPDALPNERLYYNIAQKILMPTLKNNYELVNSAAAQVQETLDKKMQFRIKAQKPSFPTERISQMISAASAPDADWETVKRRLDAPVRNVTESFCDDYVKENARFRSNSGLRCYIVRRASGGCCKWCSAIAGRYVYGEEPQDVFRRHDNCGCTTTYENGRQRQDVWTKKSWAAPETPSGEYKPVSFTPHQARTLEAQNMQYRGIEASDFGSRPGKADYAKADMEYINSQSYADKFKGKYDNPDVENAVVSACRQLVKNRNGTYFEEAFFINSQTGETISYVKSKRKNGVNMPEELKKRLTNAPENSIIMIHNHPNSSPLSSTDYLTSTQYASLYEVVACGHNGDVYAFRHTFGTQGAFHKSSGYEAEREFYIAYQKYSRSYSDFEARSKAWESVAQNRGFIYEKR